MAAIGMILMLVGGIASLVGAVNILIVAFRESVGQGLCNLLLGPYALYYVFTRWEACKKGFLLNVGGGVAVVLGMVLGAAGAAG